MEGLAVRNVITLRYFTSLIARADRTLSINRLMMAVTLTVNMTFIPFRLVFSVQLTNQSQVCVVPTIRIEHHSALQHGFPASSFEAKHPEQRASVSLGLTLPLCQTEWSIVFCRIPMGNRARSCLKKLRVTGVEGEEKKKNRKRRGRAEPS